MPADRPPGAGRSSFDLVDRQTLVESLAPLRDAVLLDLGSGTGNYTLALADIVGPGGRVYAFDAWPEAIRALEVRAREAGFHNVEARIVDVRQGLPLGDRSIDLCLMATVLHDLIRDGLGEVALAETKRLLKPAGRLAIVEFKKMDGPPGPPVAIRLSPDELEAFLQPFDFAKDRLADLGPHLYLLLASPCGSKGA